MFQNELTRSTAKDAELSHTQRGMTDTATWPLPAGRKPDLVVPIRSLGENHRSRIGAHLKALDVHDRHFRFGYAANDAQIDSYVQRLDFERDEIFGIYNRHLVLIAVAHLAFLGDTHPKAGAEFGVSVLAQARGRHYGARLFDRALMHARNVGVSKMYVHVLSENTAMLRIARHAGATVHRDGAESEGHLLLPPATWNSQLTEVIEERMAQANYQFKVQARLINATVNTLQAAWHHE